jgi:hypothetical protein
MKPSALFALLLLSGAQVLAQNEVPLSKDGLTVGPPKVYDAYYLQMQLQSLKQHLQGLQVTNSTTLIGHIGNIQSAESKQTAISVQAGSTAAPSSTASALNMPGTGQSSLDTLNESMQLSYEITNLELVLDGALNDKIDAKTNKPRRVITIGFPITFSPPDPNNAKSRANSVAEIHVTLCRAGNDVSIMTVLPQERTYNVAGIVDHSVAVSLGGVIGGVFNVGGGFMRRHQRFDMVQQQETVALRTPYGDCEDGKGKTSLPTSFVWQVYPVLGSKYVRAGVQQNFVQFSIPGDAWYERGPEVLRACVEAGWKSAFKNGSIASSPDSPASACFSVPNIDTTPRISTLAVENVGGGNLWVTATGNFLPGTSVRVGSATVAQAVLSPAPDSQGNYQLAFPASAADLVSAGDAWAIDRNGVASQIVAPVTKESSPLTIDRIDVTPFADSQDKLTIHYTPPGGVKEPCATMPGLVTPPNCMPPSPLIATVGNHIYGLADAPFLKQSIDSHEIQVLVPASSITAGAKVTLRRLLWDRSLYDAGYSIWNDPVTVTKATTLSTAPGLHLALVGSNLDSAMLQYPTGCAACLHDKQSGFALLDIPAQAAVPARAMEKKPGKPNPPKDETKDLKQVILCKETKGTCDLAFAPVILNIPKASDDSEEEKPETPAKPVTPPKPVTPAKPVKPVTPAKPGPKSGSKAKPGNAKK